jgi:steroid delta-isomerase-like uncharacterized protein
MPAPDHVATVRRLIDAWNSHDLDRIGRVFHPDFENHQLPLPPVRGRDAYLRHCAEWFTAFPDFRIEAVSLFGDGRRVCLESRGGGTRAAGFFGAPASGRVETNYACDVFEFEDDLIRRERGYWDFSVATGHPAPMAGGHGEGGSPAFRRP